MSLNSKGHCIFQYFVRNVAYKKLSSNGRKSKAGGDLPENGDSDYEEIGDHLVHISKEQLQQMLGLPNNSIWKKPSRTVSETVWMLWTDRVFSDVLLIFADSSLKSSTKRSWTIFVRCQNL